MSFLCYRTQFNTTVIHVTEFWSEVYLAGEGKVGEGMNLSWQTSTTRHTLVTTVTVTINSSPGGLLYPPVLFFICFNVRTVE